MLHLGELGLPMVWLPLPGGHCSWLECSTPEVAMSACSACGMNLPCIGFELFLEEGDGWAARVSADFGEFLMDEVILRVECGGQIGHGQCFLLLFCVWCIEAWEVIAINY